MNKNPVGWFEIYVQDMERAKTFYEAVFDTRLEKLESPDSELWAFPMDPEESGRAAQHGGSVVQAKFPIGEYGFIAHILDADGNMIGLHSLK